MADMLKFRKGTLAQIKAAPPVVGTVYIAKDEKAMYVDIANGEGGRIRIGDLIRVTSIDKIEPPFSTTSLYYVENDNALLGYDGKNWKQINGTEELVARIAAVESDVSTLKGAVGSTSSGLVKDVADLKLVVGEAAKGDKPATGLVKNVADNASDIADLKNAIDMGTGGNTGGIGATVAQLSTDLDTLEDTVATQGNTISEHTGKISTLETASALHALKTDLNAYAKTADIQSTLNKIDTDSTISAAISSAVTVEKNRAELAEQTLTNNLAAVKNTADSAVSNATFEQFKTANTTAINDAKTSAVSEATVAANGYTDGKITDEVNRANGAYAPISLVETVAGHTSALSILNGNAGTDGSVANAKKAGTDALTAIGDNSKGLIKDIKANTNALIILNGDANTPGSVANAKKAGTDALATANANVEALSALTGRVDDLDAVNTGRVSILEGDVNALKTAGYATVAQVDAAKAAILGTTTGGANYNGTVKGAYEAAAGAKAIADANTGEIAGLKDAVGSPKQGTGNGTEGNAAASGLYKLIEDGDNAIKTELENTITEKINAANAMDYQHGIGSQTVLDDIVTPKTGDTYVVTAQFGDYYPGDLLIATGEEDEATGTIPTEKLSWTWVKTGYDASLEQKLEAVDNKVQLSSIANVNNGQISFVSDGSAVTVSVTPVSDTDKNPVVTIGMVWEDFGE